MEGKPERPAQMADKKLTRMTSEAIKAQLARRSPQAVAEARKRYDETTEEDIRRHMREDEADPEDETPVDTRLSVPVKLVRERLRMTQTELAALLHVPLGTLRNWEQKRFSIDPAVQALLVVLYREPEAALRALRHAA
jgi:putative transcriptional regulator